MFRKTMYTSSNSYVCWGMVPTQTTLAFLVMMLCLSVMLNRSLHSHFARWRLQNIPVRDNARCLARIANVSEELLRTVEPYEVEISRLFYWAFNLPSSFPVQTRNRVEFFDSLQPYYISVGKVLQSFSFNPTGTTLDWTSGVGCFRLKVEKDQEVLHVINNSDNSLARLPMAILVEMLPTFEIQNNWLDDEACLQPWGSI